MTTTTETPGAFGIEAVDPSTPGALICGTCGRAWLEDITPAGRCPWEYDHPSVDQEDTFLTRLHGIVAEISLGMNCRVRIGQSQERNGALFLQIVCWRMDVITKKPGLGYGGKAWPSPHATDSEIIQSIFGLYKGYWEHEARETFEWRGRRPFGPHISTEALWSVARQVDVRSARHVEDRQG
ncbi:hypothetical protein HOT74_gp82 [Microbacterium phage KaiHaiDragon]|uniref:Uncharacterized protein n=4 Tax=Caudoviricetes TaxID=2731619 RepID=A0A345MI12_9CAUD|nr:hypothetical protein HOT74_gp82 [Microbacterium phage KaiHaiDragon]QTF81597.1 hypothetical protein SEA_PULCHRA_82 [Microbacterium phage Pulchra]UQT01913.1 hypothetical protein SEA_SAVANNAH_79 [Microbacterium phage Savannah]UVG34556.1 hypothetical protein EARICKHC_81 [Microbacterium phage EarickHC]UVK58652.1 hypothetical protein SEA_CRAZYRICH_78 [Microbacterium phage CrazyRich]WNM67783.1 hypothetical protein SEA_LITTLEFORTUNE_81 [Microbacterium phage LittleFortune]